MDWPNWPNYCVFPCQQRWRRGFPSTPHPSTACSYRLHQVTALWPVAMWAFVGQCHNLTDVMWVEKIKRMSYIFNTDLKTLKLINSVLFSPSKNDGDNTLSGWKYHWWLPSPLLVANLILALAPFFPSVSIAFLKYLISKQLLHVYSSAGFQDFYFHYLHQDHANEVWNHAGHETFSKQILLQNKQASGLDGAEKVV